MIVFIQHARASIDERRIKEEWVRRVLAAPEWIEADKTYPDRMLAFARIPEFGNRLLRVVYSEVANEKRVITAFFDRGRAKLRRGP